MKNDTDKETKEAAKAIAPLAKFAKENVGTIGQVAERLTKLTGRKVHRQQVEVWLGEDAKRQPRLGMGLLLLQVAGELTGNFHRLKGDERKTN